MTRGLVFLIWAIYLIMKANKTMDSAKMQSNLTQLWPRVSRHIVPGKCWFYTVILLPLVGYLSLCAVLFELSLQVCGFIPRNFIAARFLTNNTTHSLFLSAAIHFELVQMSTCSFQVIFPSMYVVRAPIVIALKCIE